jgi:hypothetical protein
MTAGQLADVAVLLPQPPGFSHAVLELMKTPEYLLKKGFSRIPPKARSTAPNHKRTMPKVMCYVLSSNPVLSAANINRHIMHMICRDLMGTAYYMATAEHAGVR